MEPSVENLRSVDAYLAAEKRLQDLPPIWFKPPEDDRWVANWPIFESDGTQRSYLSLHMSLWKMPEPSASLVFRSAVIAQVDIAPSSVRKPNPPWAHTVNASPFVEGSHWHPWRLNRQHILRQRRWDMPCREEIPATIRRVPHMLIWLAEQVGLTLHHDHYGFDAPTKTDLFERDGQ